MQIPANQVKHIFFSGVAGLRFIAFIWKAMKQKNNPSNPVDPVQEAINEIKHKIIWLPSFLLLSQVILLQTQ
jgi:hypothetical protein